MYVYPECFACVYSKENPLLGEFVRACRLLTLSRSLLWRQERGDLSNLKRTDSFQVFVSWDLIHMYKVKGRVQKMLIFSKNLHEQPQKSFGALGRIQFWWSEDGRGWQYKAMRSVAEILPWKFWRKTTTTVLCSIEVLLLQPPSPFDLLPLSPGQINS